MPIRKADRWGVEEQSDEPNIRVLPTNPRHMPVCRQVSSGTCRHTDKLDAECADLQSRSEPALHSGKQPHHYAHGVHRVEAWIPIRPLQKLMSRVGQIDQGNAGIACALSRLRQDLHGKLTSGPSLPANQNRALMARTTTGSQSAPPLAQPRTAIARRFVQLIEVVAQSAIYFVVVGRHDYAGRNLRVFTGQHGSHISSLRMADYSDAGGVNTRVSPKKRNHGPGIAHQIEQSRRFEVAGTPAYPPVVVSKHRYAAGRQALGNPTEYECLVGQGCVPIPVLRARSRDEHDRRGDACPGRMKDGEGPARRTPPTLLQRRLIHMARGKTEQWQRRACCRCRRCADLALSTAFSVAF